MCTATRTHRCAPAIKNTHDYTHRCTSQERARMQTLSQWAALSGTCTRPKNNTPVVHMSARKPLKSSLIWIPSHPLVSSHHCLLACILLIFVFCQIPGVRHISYFHHRRQPGGPAALQKSKVLSKTPVPFQNPVMCYNVAHSRMLYLSSDCHFLYISVIQLMCRGLGKGLLGD